MAYLNLYNPPHNPAAAFNYPLSVGYGQPARKPPIYLQLPAASSRVFGAPPIRLTDADSTRVQFDGDSAYERKMTGVGGLGGLGDEELDILKQQAEAKGELGQARVIAMQKAHPNIVAAESTVLDVMKNNPLMTGLVVLMAGAFGIVAFKTISKFF